MHMPLLSAKATIKERVLFQARVLSNVICLLRVGLPESFNSSRVMNPLPLYMQMRTFEHTCVFDVQCPVCENYSTFEP